MSEQFKKHIEKFVKINEQEFAGILGFCKPISVKKKQNLLAEGKVCNENYFVVKGCLRLFFVNDKGAEQTIQFALENWWLADYTSFSTRQPSGFFIQAVEKSELLALTLSDQETMLQKFPLMERYFRLIHQRAHAASQFRTRYWYNLSIEEYYRQFILLYPEFVQRIPQYLLASFLGFTPEYLSKIRSKKIS
jgi:CRP/FNR family transcriptional regulator